ncbi:hypothetical protein Scep_005138 [Stephania cephalantha]|uniref:Uncharacterized protein n=1 Tax=Stephania cephalantha TaxID=152367 RepID=A0AAP0KWN4_9MAGN
MFQNLVGQMVELLNILRAQVAAQTPVIHVAQEVPTTTLAAQEEQATSAVRSEGEPIVAVLVRADPAVFSGMTYRSRIRESDRATSTAKSLPLGSRAPSRDDYTTIFYPPACMAVGGGFRPLAFPTTKLEYASAAQVHEFA